MSRLHPILRAAIGIALLAALPARAIAPQVMTYSGYLKTSGGAPVTAATNITFRLYTTFSGGAAVWTETVSVTPTGDGWFSAVVGTTSPLPFSVLSQDLYLSLQVGGDAEFTQRARVTPSHAALTVDWGGVQGKPTCTAGAFLTLDGATGSLLCQIPSTGGGGVTTVTATTPVNASITGSSLSISLIACGPGPKILQWDGNTWACTTPATGGVTSVTATGTTPISVVNTGGAVQLSMNQASGSANGYLASADFTTFNNKLTPPAGCTLGNAITATATGWGCSQVSGPVSVASPLVNGGTTAAPVVSLPTCASGEVLKFTGPPPTTWTCQPDANSGGSVTGIATGTGLTGGSPTAITSTGTIAIDTAVVPQLGAATNSFSGTVAATTFSGSGSGLTSLNAANLAAGTVPSARVAGAYGGITGVGTLTGLAVTGDSSFGGSVVRGLAPAVALQTASFANTLDTSTGGVVTKMDGILQLSSSAGTLATLDVRTNNGGTGYGTPTAGSYLAFRGNFGSISDASHTIYVMFGAATGVGSQTGGYGFRILGTGTGRTAAGIVMGAGGVIGAVTPASSLTAAHHAFFAINRGSTVEFFVDGVSLGSASAAGMSSPVFTTYSVHFEQPATAASGSMSVWALTLGMPAL